MKHGASFRDPCRNYITILSRTSSLGHLNVVEFLLENGLGENLNEALKSACECGNLDIMKYLIEHGANIHSCYLLNIACRYGYLHIAKFLVEQGINIHYGDDFSFNVAVKHGRLEIVKFLLEHGVDPNACLQSISDTCACGHVEMIKFLMDLGVKIRCYDLNIILPYVCQKNDPDLMKFFIENSADPHYQNDLVLRWACDRGYKNFIKTLWLYQTRIDDRQQSRCKHCCFKMINFLLTNQDVI